MGSDSELDARRRRTVVWVVSLATAGLIFDGYDLVVYGTVVSTFLRNPNEIGSVTPQFAGALGSYALIGVLVGAMLAGTVGDIIGRRKVMLTAYAWFSIGMGATALTHTAPIVRAMAVYNRSRRRRSGRHDRRYRERVRPARKKEPDQMASGSSVTIGSAPIQNIPRQPIRSSRTLIRAVAVAFVRQFDRLSSRIASQ
jgi:hypothetical protein